MASLASRISPMETLSLLHAFEEGWNGKVKVTLTVEETKHGHLRYQMKVETEAEVTPEGDREHFEAGSHWPTTSHETVLGLMIWLAHQVDSQVSATRTLRAR